MEHSAAFGPHLRRLRLAAGYTLTGFAGQVHYSKGYLSRVETGRQHPTPALARLCDAMLGADGRLIALAAQPEGAGRMPPLNRRDALTAATATATALWGWGAAGRTAPADTRHEDPVAALSELFTHLRRLGQISGAAIVLPMVVAQTRVVEQFAAARGEPQRRGEVLALAARFAEYTGWMTQEAGDEAGALHWTRRAAQLADAGGDAEFAGYALIRQALVSMYRRDHAATIGPAQAARRTAVSPHVQSQAARREAQGHALAGDYTAAMRCLDEARDLADRAEAEAPTGPATPALGPTHLPDPVAMVTGWCLHDLGRPKQAAAQLDAQFARLAPDALRSQARYGIRRALAHAASGEIDHACAVTAQLLPTVDAVGSATVAVELRELGRILRRYSSTASVRALLPDLTESLRIPHPHHPPSTSTRTSTSSPAALS